MRSQVLVAVLERCRTSALANRVKDDVVCWAAVWPRCVKSPCVWSSAVAAPRDCASARFAALYTPVTSAPKRLASWTAGRLPRQSALHERTLGALDLRLSQIVQGQQATAGNGRSFLIRQVDRSLRQRCVLRPTHLLRIRAKDAAVDAKDRIARFA